MIHAARRDGSHRHKVPALPEWLLGPGLIPSPIRRGVQLECPALAHPGGRTTRHGFRTDQAQDLSHHARRESCLDRRRRGAGLRRDHDRARWAVGRRGYEQHQAAPSDPPGHVSRRDDGGPVRAVLLLPAVGHALRPASGQPLGYRGGQGPIVHLQADLHATVAWAHEHGRRWSFTLGNAGARHFEDRHGLEYLGEIDWQAVRATDWRSCKEGKQAEFLLEYSFPWSLVEYVGVASDRVSQQVLDTLCGCEHSPTVEVRKDWYYG